ncbi:MAG: DUF294 nucleotidyltransferase-like domain-containing protein [Armatimonadota bacterium]
MRVDLHCHSIYSDGNLGPREIADLLSASGTSAASLTDHDTVDGQDAFSEALTHREIGCITGVEITTRLNGEDIHLLAYGFDPENHELKETLYSLRQTNVPEVLSIAESIYRKGSQNAGGNDTRNTAPNGRIDISDAIALIHRAGGRAFLAHPLIFQSDLNKLESLLITLKEFGLDGIEAIYEPFTEEQRESLCDLAKRLGLLVSAGTDAHDYKIQNNSQPGIEMPNELWREFRDAVCSNSSLSSHDAPDLPAIRPSHPFRWRDFIFHFLFPSLLAIILFVTAIYAIFLPTFEKSLMDRKREMIRELTNSAWSILVSYERDERAGKLSRSQAQDMAKSRIESLRYGRGSKDYFWLQDMHPRMIMHPYRKDLNGMDVSNFKDPRGVRIFVEFADLVNRGQDGYVEYVWQWKDDPSRLVPKESYIKRFKPWGWIIGTGIYIEDVKQEINRIEKNLVQTSLGISIIVVLLLMYVVRRGLRSERDRAEAEEGLRESTERYRSLAEASTEGTLLVLEGRCRYANRVFLEMLGYTRRELMLLDLTDLFPKIKDNEPTWKNITRLLNSEEVEENFDGTLHRRDGSLIECILSPSRISISGRDGFILLTRQVGYSSDTTTAGDTYGERWKHLRQVVDNVPIGLFRARATSRGTIIEYNSIAEQLLSGSNSTPNAPVTLANLFNNTTVYEEFLAELQKEGNTERRLHLSSIDLSTRTVEIIASLVRDENGSPRYIDGIVEDITLPERRSAELESSVEKLQSSLLFLHQPIRQFQLNTVYCKLDTSIRDTAAMMTEHQSSASLVQSETGDIVGIVTDRDIRKRAVASDIDQNAPVYRIMSSPLVTIPERAETYEALLLMEQKGIQHLAVEDDSGRVVGVVSNNVLLQFRNYGPIVLTREVEQADTPEDVVRACQRAPGLAKTLLECGAQPHHVTRMISSVCDAATMRLISLAEKELGKSPVPFTFLALGSHGRQEMTLSSDQDNAIIYEPTPESDTEYIESYMNKLGSYVCGWLNKAGYPFCHGNVMASNPQWCKSLSVWKQYFSEWIYKAEPQQLLDFTVFFDFRPVYGEIELAHELRKHVFTILRENPGFYPHFAQNSLTFKPPVRLFGRILIGGAGGEHYKLDLKDAVMPIVSFARLYALKQELNDTHTSSRLKTLMEKDTLTELSYHDITSAYDFLMLMRLKHQASTLISGQMDNTINFRKLGSLDETLLNQSFAQITAIQKRINYDFLGGSS